MSNRSKVCVSEVIGLMLLAGHGRRVAFKDVEEKNTNLKAFLTAKQHTTHVY